MADRHKCTRQIGIDMGHRVPDHGSKCRHLHGHRYTIEATCSGPLAEAGEQNGMVIDFGFLKEAMLEAIDRPFDHQLCLWKHDPQVVNLFEVIAPLEPIASVDHATDQHGNRLVLIDRVPTAENLAALWYEQLEVLVESLTEGRATLESVKVWETPNCWAEFPA